MVQRAVGLVLLILLAGVFFFSAYSKIYSNNAFDNFQWSFIDIGVGSQLAAGIIARLMIGFELMLGLFLLAHIFLKQFTYKAVIAILVLFIIYLLFLLVKQGNTGNCGCFGDKFAMTPLAAIVKNLVMIAVTVALMFIYPVRPYRFQEYLLMLLALVAFSAPFLYNNVYIGTEPVHYKNDIDLSLLYKYSPTPETDLRKGKHIIAFMSLTCPHCKKAAYLLQMIHRDHPQIPMFLVIDGPAEYKFEKDFFDETHAMGVPHLIYRHSNEFAALAGLEGVPMIYWVNNGKIEYKSNYYQLTPSFMEQWARQQ